MTRRQFLRTAAGATAVAYLPFGAAASETAGGGDDLNPVLAPILKESGLPALAAGAMKNGRVLGLGAVGLRMVGSEEPVTVNDKFHIGSCTKAMTSTLAAIYVDSGKLRWTSKIPDIFPERREKIDAAFREVTLEMLLTHRAGLPHDGPTYGKAGAPVNEQRLAYMDAVLAKPPPNAVDTFNYSNAGYVIAGAMLERITGQTWEESMRGKLFKPLGMDTGGFGVAMTDRRTDQPWPHVKQGGKFVARYGDNHRGIGPAGTVHCSIRDYLKFAGLHSSSGRRPEGIIAKAICERLHQPAKDGYAFGWGVVERGWARGKALTHAGSNGMNYFVVWVAPETDFALAVATNASDDQAPSALDKVAGELVKRYSGA